MAGTNVFDGDLVVRGTLKASAFQPPNGSIGNNQVGSADPIDASKLKHQYLARLVQPSGSSATAVTQAVHHAHAAGSVVGVEVGAVVAATGADTVTVDVKKNGTTVLSGVVTLDSSTAAYAAVLGGGGGDGLRRRRHVHGGRDAGSLHGHPAARAVRFAGAA